MKINNRKKIIHSALGMLSFLVLIGSLLFTNAINKEWIMAIFFISLFISILFLQINYIQFKSTEHNIIIKRKFFLFKRQNRILVKIPKENLKSYHIQENCFSYELIMFAKNKMGSEETFKIRFFGFSWKMIIRMIQSLEHAKKTYQLAGE